MRTFIGVAAMALVLTSCGDGLGAAGAASSTRPPDVYDDYAVTVDGARFVDEVRAAEELVVGEVFTEHMTGRDLVLLAAVLCEVAEVSGGTAALEEARSVVDRLDWNSPAHGEMIGTVFDAAGLTVCTADLPSPGLPLGAIVVPRPQNGSVAPLGDVEATIQAFIDSDRGQAFLDLVRDEERRLSPVFTEQMTDMEVVRLVRGICQTETELGAAAAAEHRLFLEAYGWTSEADLELFEFLIAESAPVCATVGA